MKWNQAYLTVSKKTKYVLQSIIEMTISKFTDLVKNLDTVH